MKRIDLHDDALLDCARRGRLSPAQEQRLLAHCHSCAACALELAWIDDGLHAAVPRAEDHARGRAAVDAVLGLGAAASEWPRTESAFAPAPRARPRGAGVRVSSAAALALLGLLVSSAAAAFFTGALPALPRMSRWLQAVDAPPAHVAPARKHARAQHARALASQPAVTFAAGQAAGTASMASVFPVPPVLPPSAASVNVVPEVAPAARAAVLRERPAEALLSTANQARAAGDYGAALARYLELSRRYAGTRAEVLSRVSRGNLWLTSLAEPARAESAFASYLAARPSGVLAEEARVGRARSLAQLGRRAQERAAWAELIERHPDSLHVAYARARLATLSP